MNSLVLKASDIVHKYFKIPYTLNVEVFQSPKKPKATFVFIHGIGNNLHSWDKIVSMMPKDVRLIGIDLLGFGKSPRPGWAVYDAKTQARSVAVTLLGLCHSHQLILVGHSLGALVSVEVAKRYSLAIKRLVLCSPPFYKPEVVGTGLRKSNDDILRELYRVAKKYPTQLLRLSPMAVKLGLANKTLDINDDNVTSYIGALESSIINQTSLEDVAKLKIPIDILSGTFDPVVIKKHISTLAKENENITSTRLAVAHEVKGKYMKSLASFLTLLTSR